VSILRPFSLALLLGLAAALAPDTSRAQPIGEKFSGRSRSGQFVVQTIPPPRFAPAQLHLETNPAYVELEPLALPVGCDRIRDLVWHEVGATGPWSGKIFLVLHPAQSADELITWTSERFRNGWEYRLDLPDLVERVRYLRAVVQVVLLAIANRNASDHSADIPAWLVEGCVQQLLASKEVEIFLPRPKARANGVSFALAGYLDKRRESPLKAAHDDLTARVPLSFEELSWPRPGQLSRGDGEHYRACAQLFLNELQGLSDGKARLFKMVSELPQYYNWQFAFLDAFGNTFQRPLDVEKWWTLHTSQFTGRDLDHTWPSLEGRRRLLECVQVPVQVRAETNALPGHTDLKLQTVLREWSFEKQKPVLESRLAELEVLRLHLTPPLALCAVEYRKILMDYLQRVEHPGLTLPFRRQAAQNHAAQEAIARLDAADRKVTASDLAVEARNNR
jgi:hypothetical protein